MPGSRTSRMRRAVSVSILKALRNHKAGPQAGTPCIDLQVASERDFLMILLAYRHGLRASEVCVLTAQDFADGFITVRTFLGRTRALHKLSNEFRSQWSEQRLNSGMRDDNGHMLNPV